MILEDEDGNRENIHERDLKSILEDSFNYQPEFVLLASFHSRKIGEIFLEFGSKHVISVNRDKKLDDRVAIEFVKVFYQHFFSCNYSVCTSYKLAQQHL